MANELSVIGQTALSWSLSDKQDPTSYAASAQKRSTRSIANGTGVGQANAAWSTTMTITGTNEGEVDLNTLGLAPFGTYGYITLASLREMLVNVTTGPTGGYVVVYVTGVSPTAPANFPVGVGGQLHYADYNAGLGVSALDYLRVRSAVTGTYSVDVTLVGVGTFST